MDIQKLSFPIGKYRPTENPGIELINAWIKDIEEFPAKLEQLTKNISFEKLEWKYRPNGWSVKQVIHHCADSHMNSIIRFKLALTEDSPVIRPYEEDKWAELFDYNADEIQNSLALLKALHRKWIILLKSLSSEQLALQFVHPEHGRKTDLAQNIGIYAWHCNHHYAHVLNGINSKGIYN